MENYTLLIHPPFLKYNAGPPLGPCLLMQKCQEENLPVRYLDLNFEALKRLCRTSSRSSKLLSTPMGDHARDDFLLEEAESDFFSELGFLNEQIPIERLKRAQINLDEVENFDKSVSFPELEMLLSQNYPPRAVAFSVMVARQVIWVIFAAQKIRQKWPQTKILLGGAYMGILDFFDEQVGAEQQSTWLSLVDLIMIGHAEESFACFARKIALGEDIVWGRVAKGDWNWNPASSGFTVRETRVYREFFSTSRPMVPVQTSVGCKWGKCKFCTYPIVEPKYEVKSVDLILGQMLELACEIDGVLVIKDSYVEKKRLLEMANFIQCRIPWTACTRLPDAAIPGIIEKAVKGGLHTLEIGLETIDQGLGKKILKPQSKKQLHLVCKEAQRNELVLVLNVIWGLPGQTEGQAEKDRYFLKNDLPLLYPDLHFHLEENILELERGADFAKNPEEYGITPEMSWPFAVEIAYNRPTWTKLFLEKECLV